MVIRSPNLFVELDRSRPRGLRAQVEQGLRDAIRSGRLAPGARLPSSRALAEDLGVTRGLVVAAYEQLTAEGYLDSRQGSGTIVSPELVPTDPQPRRATVPATPPLLSFTPAHPDLRLFPRRAWARAFQSVWQTMPDDLLGYGDPMGLPVLRSALADYLGRVRGVACEPGQVVICSGISQAFELMAGLLASLGHTTVGVEDPGDRDLDPLMERAGLEAVPVPLDGEGLQVDHLEASGSRAVVVTPANQFPTGVVMSAARRHRLSEWARRCDGYILEDDCEAEFRHDRRAIGALQGVAPDRVLYFGVTWQSLAPGLRIGWFVVPPMFVDLLAAGDTAPAAVTSSILQATFAEFLVRGDLDRHLRTVRKAYARRREALLDAIGRWFPGARTTGVAAGLHVLVLLPASIDAELLATEAKADGVEVEPLARFRADRSKDHPRGLVLGYASLTPAQIDRGIEQLARTSCRITDPKGSSG
jgi:GntR family transcriptional regulator/MocR family aminotransferase